MNAANCGTPRLNLSMATADGAADPSRRLGKSGPAITNVPTMTAKRARSLIRFPSLARLTTSNGGVTSVTHSCRVGLHPSITPVIPRATKSLAKQRGQPVCTALARER
jgi:hypothetical protein